MTVVLFTGGGGAGSEALARLLPYECHFADADPDARPAGIAPDRWHVISRADQPGFFADVSWLCTGVIGAALIVPGVDEELTMLAVARDTMWSQPVLLPPSSFVAAHLDKLASYELLRDAEIPVPWAEVVRNTMYDRFPCIIKPRRGRGSRGVAVAEGIEDLLDNHDIWCADYIAQELLVGQEYTVTVAADAGGKLRAIVPVLVSLKRGITIRAHTTHDSAVTEACERIHAAYPVPGCYNVQGIKGADGVFRPFEINPRVSTTLCLAVAAGVDPIAIYRGNCPGDELLPFREVSLRRSWHNEFAEVA